MHARRQLQHLRTRPRRLLQPEPRDRPGGTAAAQAGAAHALLGALEYKEGKRYADFDANTDHVAEYGLAALVVGVAAKKLGFIALAVAFFAKFAKVILLGVAVLGAAFVKFFGKRKPKVAATAPSGETPQV